ncbi:LAME_0D00386g1_1 [Lachancea meyersii CBS 8951]|uniref:LAME_0D00386g1_1 n=1 Tax=Lachancea meyersii CBS 8951 TaxID=1266667 RepID=A0A1G4J5S1_9SACH|nr:LAME_0D00386g1_1 [Lachancea meyersii CBS 8951]
MLRSIAASGKKTLGHSRLSMAMYRNLSAEAFKATGAATPITLKNKSRPMRIERDLPDPTKDRLKNRAQLGLFVVAIGVSLACIFNYEKTQSPIVSNSLYHMRRSQKIRDLLGDSIDFDGLVPWVYGDLNQVAGRVNISFYIRGSNDVQGIVKLVADRENKHQEFLIHDWSVTVNGKKIDLLTEEGTKFL